MSTTRVTPQDYRTVDSIEDEEERSCCYHVKRCGKAVYNFVDAYFLLSAVIILVAFAFLVPDVGTSLAPAITSSYIAVALIFLIVGLNLRTRELANAAKHATFNAFIQTYNLVFLPFFGFLVGSTLKAVVGLNVELADGVIIAMALPQVINMAIVLTRMAGGDEAIAVCNSAIGNSLGIFMTPMWIVLFLGSSASINLLSTLFQILLTVILPVALGQIIQYRIKYLADLAARYKPKLKRLQEASLAFIVFCTFSAVAKAQREGTVVYPWADVLIVIAIMVILFFTNAVGAWYLTQFFFPREPELLGYAVFGGPGKTVALGIPFISALFSSSPSATVGIYELPLLVYWSTMLVAGSFVSRYVGAIVIQKRRDLDALNSPLLSPKASSSGDMNPVFAQDSLKKKDEASETSSLLSHTAP